MRIAPESPNTHIILRSKATLRELSKRERKPMQTVLDEAIELYRREKFFQELNAGYVRLQTDPEAWSEELAERRLWDTTLMDDLD